MSEAGAGYFYPDSPADLIDAEAPTDPFGGHEFHYETHTDLFRFIQCHMYEVVARADGPIKPCPGQPPANSGPIEVNAW